MAAKRNTALPKREYSGTQETKKSGRITVGIFTSDFNTRQKIIGF